MKIFSIVLTLFFVLYFTNEIQFDFSNPNSSSKKDYSIELLLPSKLEEKHFPFEEKWLKLNSEPVVTDEKQLNKLDLNNTVGVLIGDELFEFSGVFIFEDSSFILLIDEQSKVVKLTLGDTLSNGYVLKKIDNNIIEFSLNDNSIQLNLFEINKK